MSYLSKALFAAAVGAVGVSAHGRVSAWIVDGVSYEGFDPTVSPNTSAPPLAGWATTNTDLGPVTSIISDDVICHNGATNAQAHIPVSAGSKILAQWTTWPVEHHGPMLGYLAACGGPGCETVDKTTLQFVKIDAVGLVDDTTPPGIWGSDILIANNNSWLLEIPPTIAPGAYVLRHEIISLQIAATEGGAQSFPQCVNLLVSGSGSDTPEGTLGTSLYKLDDAGILINISQTLTTYEMPGPTLYSGAVSVSQTSVAATATSTAIAGSATPSAPLKNRRHARDVAA